MQGIKPWHLWGDSKTTELARPAGAAVFTQATDQIVRINYGRPENWRFFFMLEVLESDLAGGGAGAVLQVQYALTMGVGRTSATVPLFNVFILESPFFPNTVLWTTQAQAPKWQNQTGAPAQPSNLIEEFPAQDIQLQVTSVVSNVNAGTKMVIRNTAFFSPSTHIRPEWYQFDNPEAQFSGNEQNGQ